MNNTRRMLIKISQNEIFDISPYEGIISQIDKKYSAPSSSIIPDDDIKKIKESVEQLKKYSLDEVDDLIKLIEEFGEDKILSFAKKSYSEILNEILGIENLKETKAQYKKSLLKLSSKENAINLYEKTNSSIKSSIVKIASSNKTIHMSNRIYFDDSRIIGAEKSIANFAFKEASNLVKKKLLIKESSTDASGATTKASKIFKFLPLIGIIYILFGAIKNIFSCYSVWKNELSIFSKYGKISEITDPEYVERLYKQNKDDPDALLDIVKITKASSKFTENFITAVTYIADLVVSVAFLKIATLLSPTIVGTIAALLAEIGISVALYSYSDKLIAERMQKFSDIEQKIKFNALEQINLSEGTESKKFRRIDPSEVVNEDHIERVRPRRINPSEVVDEVLTERVRPRRVDPSEVR